ncbi:MAG: cyclic pyranopterin monophosphate synthase MoaC [Anaerolineae bacterium]
MELTHLDAAGHAHMVDVSAKSETSRQAIAAGEVAMLPATLALIQNGGLPKGDVLAVARVAGIMAAKRTWELIPLCHPLQLSHAAIEFSFDERQSLVLVRATIKCIGVTGLEMEALTAVSVAALTIYDMCKAVDRSMHLQNIRLLHKGGGKSGVINLESQDDIEG